MQKKKSIEKRRKRERERETKDKKQGGGIMRNFQN